VGVGTGVGAGVGATGVRELSLHAQASKPGTTSSRSHFLVPIVKVCK
jgi:hypothetical protein